MKLGLLTAAFPDLSLERLRAGRARTDSRRWRSRAGRPPAASGAATRASRTSTPRDSTPRARRRSASAHARGLEISSLAYYPNHLHPDTAHRAEVNAHLDRVVEAAVLLGVEVVGTFIGADPARSLNENLRTFAELWPAMVDRATAKGVKIAIENCPMLFSDDAWPFGTNLARTPHIWRELFNVIPETASASTSTPRTWSGR